MKPSLPRAPSAGMRPFRRVAQAGDDFQVAPFQFVEQRVGAVDAPHVALRLDVLPGEGLLDMAEDHVLNPVHIAPGEAVIPPQERLNAVGQRRERRVGDGEAHEGVGGGQRHADEQGDPASRRQQMQSI